MSNSNDIASNPTVYYMPRPRVDKIFCKATRCKLVYVIAGTGYGKTQAVRYYVEQLKEAIVRWIQLTESDNNGSCYWESYAHSISTDNPILASKLRELGFPETPARFKQFAEILRSYEHSSRRIFFVFDDFHLIHSKEILIFAERCTQLQIPSECIILISRNEPEINVVPLRTKGKARIITEDDLRFTSEEAAEFFLRQATPISQADLSQIIEATKGWALAVNMLSLILKKTSSNLKHALETMMQNIYKLLELEAWSDFPENVMKTMVKLSLLVDLPVVPLQEITGEADFLQNARKRTSFIWYDSFTNSFQIHPLYLEFLQSKHHILPHEEKQEVYIQAAKWCSENDFYLSALHYYAKSHQYESMINTLFSHPLKLPSDASEYLSNIINNLSPAEGDKINPSLIFLKSYFMPLLLAGAGKYDEAREHALAVIREWEHIDTPLSIVLLYTSYSNLSYIDMYTCTYTHEYNALEYLRKSVELFKQSNIPPAKTTTAFVNADIRSFACLVGEDADLSEFEQFLEASKKTAKYIEETPYSIFTGYEDLVACEIAFYKNQTNLAQNHAHSAIHRAHKKKQYSISAMAEQYLIRIAVNEGDSSLVREIFKQLNVYLDNNDFWNRQLYYDFFVGALYARIGLPELVPMWFKMDEKDAMSGIRIPVRELIVSVMYFIASKKYHHALTVLGHSYPREPHERFYFGELKLLLLTAVARFHTGDIAGAVEDFEKAYLLSFRGEFEMFFVELGKELHPLVVAALKQERLDIPEEWLRMIDHKASIYAKKAAVVANAFKAEMKIDEVVSLSNRESEVLTDMYHGLSREEIAVNRYLSINTVKKTLQSIYTKLDANNNVDAIRIALEKKLID